MNEVKRKKMCIYVSSPKEYKDVFDVFIKCLNKYWDGVEYPVILSTNYPATYEGVKIINSNNLQDTWTERTVKALSEIDEKYILLLCDDMLIRRKIDNRKIETIIDFMDDNEIMFCRLNPTKYGRKVKKIDFLNWTNKKMPYGINLQRGIYNKDYLIELLGDGSKSAWDIEKDLLKKAEQSKNEYFDNIITCRKNIFPVVHAVDKGCWYPKAIRFLKNEDISISINRKVMSQSKEILQDLKTFFSKLVTPRNRIRIKKILRKIGVSFTSDY